MRKSALFKTESIFGRALRQSEIKKLTPSLKIQDGEIIYRRTGSCSSIEQDFKGYLGYLQHFDWVIDRDIVVPVQVKQRDVYAIYAMRARGRLHLTDNEGKHIMALGERRARYVYLPPGDYSLHLSAGRYQLFDFYFSIGIFDDGADETFDFLKPLLDAHRSAASEPIVTVDFHVGTETEIYIQVLCAGLKKGDLDSQIFIILTMKELVKLSLEEIRQEYDPGSHAAAIAASAKLLIEINTEAYGIQYKLDVLPSMLNISRNHLQFIFKAETGQSLKQYQNVLVSKKAKALLTAQKTIQYTSDACGFVNVQSFCRFFKKETGITPAEFRDDNASKFPTNG
ncbi:helix-turn-helix domain-containing protein [Sphingobacterium alkalisoli]|nr:helix-turn-helix transcriptional regulator [Sphingobacterium alkalisoli]